MSTHPIGLTVPGTGRDPTGRLARRGEVEMETGIARKIDDLGRIVIPAETRRLFNIREGDHLFISVEGGSIILRKTTDTCTFCGSDTKVTQFKSKGLCSSCLTQLRS